MYKGALALCPFINSTCGWYGPHPGHRPQPEPPLHTPVAAQSPALHPDTGPLERANRSLYRLVHATYGWMLTVGLFLWNLRILGDGPCVLSCSLTSLRVHSEHGLSWSDGVADYVKGPVCFWPPPSPLPYQAWCPLRHWNTVRNPGSNLLSGVTVTSTWAGYRWKDWVTSLPSYDLDVTFHTDDGVLCIRHTQGTCERRGACVCSQDGGLILEVIGVV